MLTLGNKKSVDIAIIRATGDAVTLDVKALAGKTCWPVDNFRGAKERHFLALVCFLGKIDDSPPCRKSTSSRQPTLRDSPTRHQAAGKPLSCG
jgi:hypothetical protein